MKATSIFGRDGTKSFDSGKSEQAVNRAGVLVQVEGVDVKRPSYSAVADSFAKESELPIMKSLFRFEGGDIIVGASNVFLGPTIIMAAMGDFGLSWDQAVQALSLEYGKKVVPIFTLDQNSEPAPTKFHIDLMMTILRSQVDHNEVAFVESPFELLKTFLGREFTFENSDMDFLKAIEVAVTRRISEVKNGKPITAAEINLYNLLLKNRFEVQVKLEMDSRFVTHILRSNGYKVQLVPGIMVPVNSSNKYFNWTNVVPLSPGSLMVPNYGIPRIEKSVFSIFKSHGYKVLPAHSTESTIKSDGGIRCVTNCL